MHGHHHIDHIEDPGPAKIPAALSWVLLAIGIAGLAVFALSAFTGSDAQKVQAWNGFFVSHLFFFYLALGAAGFLAIQYVVGAKWFVVTKRLPEALAQYVYLPGLVFILISLLGTQYLYTWADVAGRAYPYAGTAKAAYLTPNSHYIRMVIYGVLLAGLTFGLVRVSRTKYEGDYEAVRLKRLKYSIGYLIVYTFVVSFYAWEAVMSVEPKWFSTMWGVYMWVGGFLTALCVMALLTFWLRGKFPKYVAEARQQYDYGTYVMAFATFWIYVAFSQFMLIWYANIPDETAWYQNRGWFNWEDPWLVVTLALPLLKWVVPFLILMPSTWRTKPGIVTIACLSILLGQAVDLWWTVVPARDTEFHYGAMPTFTNIATFIGIFGVFGWSVTQYLSSHSVIPVEDPDLLSSVNGEYLHA